MGQQSLRGAFRKEAGGVGSVAINIIFNVVLHTHTSNTKNCWMHTNYFMLSVHSGILAVPLTDHRFPSRIIRNCTKCSSGLKEGEEGSIQLALSRSLAAKIAASTDQQ